MKTFHPKLAEIDQNRQWWIVDAAGKTLGKLAAEVAVVLRGKNKPSFHPSVDCGDHVIVINAEQVAVTGNKEMRKEYIHHTGYPGAIRRKTLEKMRQEHPERILETAIAGMIPRNRLKKHVLSKLHVYAGDEHPHAAQKPKTLKTQ